MATFLLAALVTRQFVRTAGGIKEAHFEQTMAEARQAFVRGNRTGALERLEAASRLAPNSAEAHLDLAGKFQFLGERHMAAQHLEQMLRMGSAPGGAAGFAQLVQTYLDNGDTAQASRLVHSDLLAKWPDAPETSYAQGILTLYKAKTTQDIQQALQHFERCLQLKPSELASQVQLGIACWRLGQLVKAEPLLRQAVEKQPNNAVALFHLGQVLRAQGKLDQADKYLLEHKRISDLLERERHLEMRYSLGTYQASELLELGRIYAQMGEFRRAASSFRVYTRLKPTDPDGHQELARAAERLDDKESARVERELAQALAKAAGRP